MRLMLVLTLAGTLGLVACSNAGGGSGDPASQRTLTAAQQGKVDKAIAVNRGLVAGEDPDAVLRSAGLTEQQYDDLLFEIANDEAMSEAYGARVP